MPASKLQLQCSRFANKKYMKGQTKENIFCKTDFIH